ncbi:YopX family protein [Dysgonomonas capnocytophagoides]|uniref:YopX family protein n=1 Tax=Dysgonomonas capnocytophagoides TaxID=45254 RepID=UPI00068578E6|nr:YopX family protein [Dysgonomonas capnocytophagoides]
MRKIKFRGKRIDQDEWVVGSLVKIIRVNIKFYILPLNTVIDDDSKMFDSLIEIRPETASQFTGLVDRNGKEVYEGDILETKYEDRCEESGFGIARNGVSFKIGCFGTIGEITREFLPFSDYPIKDEYIIGNIHENPELLNEKQ